MVEDTQISRSLCVDIDVAIPMVIASTNVLNFGFAKYAERTTLKFNLRNESNAPVEWFITEYFYDLTTNDLVKAANTCADADHGYLCQIGSNVDIEYNLYTGKLGKFCSLLFVSTKYSSVTKGSTFVLIYAEIVEPALGIYDSKTETAIMRPPIGFIGIENKYTVSIRNQSVVRISIAWGAPEGRGTELIDVLLCPTISILEPLQCSSMIVTIHPKKEGVVHGLKIPCFVGKLTEPIWIGIEMEVKDIQVQIYQDGSDNYILWPEDELRSCRPEMIEYESITEMLPENISAEGEFVSCVEVSSGNCVKVLVTICYRHLW